MMFRVPAVRTVSVKLNRLMGSKKRDGEGDGDPIMTRITLARSYLILYPTWELEVLRYMYT